MTTARTLFNTIELTSDILDSLAYQKDQNYEKESTAWIFRDGSALVVDSCNYWKVVTNYGLSADNEQL